MNKINYLGLIALATTIYGCVSADLSVPDVCDTVSIGTVPGAPIEGVAVPTITFYNDFDISDTASKLNDVAKSTSIKFSKLTINSDSTLKSIHTLNVSINGDTPDMPQASFGHYNYDPAIDPGNSININMDMSADDLQRYLAHKATLTFSINGVTQVKPLVLSSTLCGNVSAHYEKTLR